MNKPSKKLMTTFAVAAGIIGIAAPLSALPKGTENYNKSFEHTTSCGDGRSIVINAPDKLWPPNHKYYTNVWVEARGQDGDPIVLTTTGTHDQYDGDVETQGAGNTGDDITSNDSGANVNGTKTVTAVEEGTTLVHTDWQVRSERSGRLKDGRTYTLTASATFDGASCTADPHTMTVPHDMRKDNR